jgi:dihydroxyacetone kinase phosphoprotein-dependent L subunit
MIEKLTIDQTKAMLIAVADCIIENEQYLTDVDNKIGDGDHGIGMRIGMINAKNALLSKTFSDISQIFKTVGMALLNSMGGASGVIFGTMFFGGVSKMESQPYLNKTLLAEILNNALSGIKTRGKAKVGDKTMVDALEPAAYALQNEDTEDMEKALQSAEQAALEGLEKTKKYIAEFGRAKTLGSRSLGFQDAGATSVWLILKAMHAYVRALDIDGV